MALGVQNFVLSDFPQSLKQAPLSEPLLSLGQFRVEALPRYNHYIPTYIHYITLYTLHYIHYNTIHCNTSQYITLHNVTRRDTTWHDMTWHDITLHIYTHTYTVKLKTYHTHTHIYIYVCIHLYTYTQYICHYISLYLAILASSVWCPGAVPGVPRELHHQDLGLRFFQGRRRRSGVQGTGGRAGSGAQGQLLFRSRCLGWHWRVGLGLGLGMLMDVVIFTCSMNSLMLDGLGEDRCDDVLVSLGRLMNAGYGLLLVCGLTITWPYLIHIPESW